MTVDTITREVVRHGLVAIAEEMNATLVRTAYSPNIKERQDCSCAIFDNHGDMISQAENIPVHLGAMPFSVAAAIEEFPVESLAPGDAILLNDPYRGGAHLPDLTLISPVIYEDELIGFAANRAHHADVGGANAGSVAATSSDIHAEGLRIPPVRLVRGGELVEAVQDLLLANTRDPRERMGDLRAQIAANRRGRERMVELFERHGTEVMSAVITESNDYAERRMRARIASLADGTYQYTDYIEADGQGNEQLPVAVAVTVADDTVTVDFSGSAPQTTSAINAVYAVTVSATYYAIRTLTDPDIPANAGCYRPISVSAPSGSIVNAEPPAAVVAGNLETSQRIVDAIFGALADCLPDRVPSASQGTMNNLAFGGVHPDTNQEYAFYETIAGGSGARAGSDGMDAVQVHMTNTMNTPIEVLETTYPLRVRRYALRPDSGGAGQYRGGLGIRRDIEVLAPDTTASLLAERRTNAPAGIHGGQTGASGADELVSGGEVTSLPAKTVDLLQPGDVIRIATPGGGGYGDPADREEAPIRRDLRLGKVTPATAQQVYGYEVSSIEDTDEAAQPTE